MLKSKLAKAVLLTACLWSIAAVAADGPMSQVRSTIEQILETLKNPELAQDVKREKIAAMIEARFDFEIMSQQTLATNWREANDEQREKFQRLFSELLRETYLGRIEAYTNEKVEYSGEKLRGNRAEIDTFIMTANADIPIRYKMVQRDGDWRVYDVVIEEVSLIRNYRTSYRDIVRSEGIDGLLIRMTEKIEEMRAAAGQPGKT